MIIEVKTMSGETVEIFVVNSKVFKTGSKGYFGSTKMEFDGKRYQVQFQMVEIGSKEKASS